MRLSVIGKRLMRRELEMFENHMRDYANLRDVQLDLLKKKAPFDEKIFQFFCLALSIKGRSAPCVIKHYKESIEVGATIEELEYIVALVSFESAGADICWSNDILSKLIKCEACR